MVKLPEKDKRLFQRVLRRKRKQFFKKCKKGESWIFENSSTVFGNGLIITNAPSTLGVGLKTFWGISKARFVSAKKLINTDKLEY